MQPSEVSYDVLSYLIWERQGRLQEILQKSLRVVYQQRVKADLAWLEAVLREA